MYYIGFRVWGRPYRTTLYRDDIALFPAHHQEAQYFRVLAKRNGFWSSLRGLGAGGNGSGEREGAG